MDAEVKVLLDSARRQHRHHHRLEEVVRLVRQRGGLCGMVVAGDHEHPTMPGGARRIAVTEHVPAAIDPGPLPYHIA